MGEHECRRNYKSRIARYGGYRLCKWEDGECASGAKVVERPKPVCPVAASTAVGTG